MIAITKYAELLEKPNDGDAVILTITNPKTRMRFEALYIKDDIVY